MISLAAETGPRSKRGHARETSCLQAGRRQRRPQLFRARSSAAPEQLTRRFPRPTSCVGRARPFSWHENTADTTMRPALPTIPTAPNVRERADARALAFLIDIVLIGLMTSVLAARWPAILAFSRWASAAGAADRHSAGDPRYYAQRSAALRATAGMNLWTRPDADPGGRTARRWQLISIRCSSGSPCGSPGRFRWSWRAHAARGWCTISSPETYAFCRSPMVRIGVTFPAQELSGPLPVAVSQSRV